MARLVLLLLLPGCADPHGGGEPRVTPASDNLLRFLVEARVPDGARASAEVWPEGGGTDEGFRTPPLPGPDVEIPLFGLRFGTRYHVRVVATDASGAQVARSPKTSFRTADRPDDFPVARVTSSADARVRWVLLNFARTSGGDPDRMLIVDRDGEIVWYQDVTPLEPDLEEAFWDGYGWDEERRAVLALVGHRRVVEQALDGTLLVDVDAAGATGAYVSHDVRRRHDRLYVPVTRSFVHDGAPWLEDGWAVLREDGVAERVSWLRDGGLDPVGDPPLDPPKPAGRYWGPWLGADAVDWTHVNAVDVAEVDGRERVLVSLKNLDQVLRVDAGTGRIEWRLGANGSGGEHSDGDFAWAADSEVQAWFGGQHDASFASDGSVRLFDNGNPDATTAIRDARGLDLALDEGTGTARQVGAVQEVGARCDYRGSARELEDGQVLVTCGSAARVDAFDTDGDVIWEAAFTCAEGKPCSLYRGIPVPDLGLSPL